jgi:hypothetical protein
MKKRTWPIVFCVCALVTFSPIDLADSQEVKWPCKDDPNLLRNKNGNVVYFPAKELETRIIWYQKPDYPKACQCSGSVQVVALINTEGGVECVQWLTGHPLLRATISETLKKWRFQPVAVR